MGRTNPTYRNAVERQEKRWQPFRRALRRRHEADFDRLFEYAARHASAAGHLNRTDPEVAMLFSMLLAVETERRGLEAQVRELEELVEELAERVRAPEAEEGPVGREGADGC